MTVDNKVEVFSQHSEVAILSLLLNDESLLGETTALLPKMFSSIPHKNIYDAIISIKKAGLVLEYPMIISFLESKSLLAICGGEQYIQWLMGQKFDKANFNQFTEYIITAFKSRELLIMSSSLSSSISGGEDVDTVITWLKGKVNSILENISETVVSLQQASQEMWDSLLLRMKGEGKQEVSTNLHTLDLVTGGYWGGEVWTIAGRPSMGKSAFMCNSIMSGVPTLIFSLEMPRQTIIQRLVAIKSGISIFNMRLGTLKQNELDLIADTIKSIRDYPIYIDTSFIGEANYITSTIRKYHKEKNIRVVHIDYIQLLIERSNSATHDLGKVMRDLKLLANELEITIVVYSQLNRLVEARDDKRPILSDIRQSGNIEEDTDVAVFLYRDIVYNSDTKDPTSLELIVRKQRNGPTGTVFAKFIDFSNKIMAEK